MNVTRISEDFLIIDSIDFGGPFTTSPNGSYTLTWDYEKSYILLGKDEIILRGEIQGPSDGHVADNGNLVLNCIALSKNLGGTFYAIDRQGNVLVKKCFQANLFNNGISSDGMFAVCQTCNSDNEDGDKLSFFDLCTRKMLWTKPPESDWADSYEFDVNNGFLYLVYKDRSRYAYNF